MDSGKDLLSSLVPMARSIDDTGYITYGSKGLLRRAKKSFGSGDCISLLESTGDQVVLQVQEYTVVMKDDGPLKSVCTCPAPGACIHVIMACLKLDDLAETNIGEEVGNDRGKDEWLAITTDQLRKWTGSEMYRRAWRIIDTFHPVVQANEVRFNNNLLCCFVPSAGLDGVISDAPLKEHKAYVAAAVITLQAARGVALVRDAESVAGNDFDWLLLNEVQDLLEQLVEVGLNHLSPSLLQRMYQLAVFCRTGRLYRPAKELEGCAQQVDWLLNRSAKGDIRELFDRLARLYALTMAIKKQAPEVREEFVGSARSSYGEMESITLVGMGTYPWEVESGFIGLTSLFWAPELGRYFSWSESRPTHSTGGFSPIQRYEDESPWRGGTLLKTICHSRFTLEKPKVNQDGRLSAHQDCSVKEMWPLKGFDDYPEPYTNWSELRNLMKARNRIGLCRTTQLDTLCLIKPVKWLEPEFDEIDQSLTIPLEDIEKGLISLKLPFSRFTQSAIYYLESSYKKNKKTILFGWLLKGQQSFFPVSLIHPDNNYRCEDLLFTPLPKKTITWKGMVLEKIKAFVPLPKDNISSLSEADTESDEIILFLSPVDSYLMKLAESGYKLSNQGIVQPDLDLAGAGLMQIARDFEHLNSAGNLLMARYHYLLHLDAL